MTRLAIVATHPIQYYSPWFRHLAQSVDLRVFYAHHQTAEGQAAAGFSTPFEWDLPLLDGYAYEFLENRARRPGLSTFDGCDTPEITDTIACGNFDAVMTLGWNKKSYVQAGLGARRAGTPLLVRVDSHLRMPGGPAKSLIKRAVYSCVLPWAAHYLSPGLRTDEYLRHYGVPSGRIHRVGHMVDTERFAAGAAAGLRDGGVANLRRQHGAGADDFVFLFVGKLIPRKQTALILRAFQQLAREGVKAHLWFAGDGPLREQLVEAAASTERVSFLGFVNQSQLPTVYAASDCLLLPTKEETWGLVVNEAFACGVPAIVADDVGCAPDLIEKDRTGWTAAPEDLETLVAAMRSALDRARSLPRDAIAAKTAAGSYAVGARQLLEAISAARRADAGAIGSQPVPASKEEQRA